MRLKNCPINKRMQIAICILFLFAGITACQPKDTVSSSYTGGKEEQTIDQSEVASEDDIVDSSSSDLKLHVGKQYHDWMLVDLQNPMLEDETSFVAVFEGQQTISGVAYVGPWYPDKKTLVFLVSDKDRSAMPLSDMENINQGAYTIYLDHDKQQRAL